MFSLSTSIRLKWVPECRGVCSDQPVDNCQTESQTQGPVITWCQDVSGAHGPVVRESVGVLFCDKRRLPTPGSERDISVHLLTGTMTDTMNWKQDIIVIMHLCGQLSPSMIVVCGPSLQLETNVRHHHSLRLRHKGWLHPMVDISSNENKWVNDIMVSAGNDNGAQLETLLLSPRFVFYETCPVLIISG